MGEGVPLRKVSGLTDWPPLFLTYDGQRSDVYKLGC